jgi:hypothetical protein
MYVKPVAFLESGVNTERGLCIHDVVLEREREREKSTKKNKTIKGRSRRKCRLSFCAILISFLGGDIYT